VPPSLKPLSTTVLTPDGTIAERAYALIEEIGRGATGTVWRGRATATGREYAIKILNDDQAEAPKAVARFLQERAILLRLRHENLVTVHDLLTTADGHPALVLDLVTGGTLRDLLNERHTLSATEAAGLLAQVAAGLAVAHRSDVVHRDLKPDNILLAMRPDGGTRIRLTDFGIARVMDGPRMTTTGAVLGTPNYMAPEVIEGGPAAPGADVYALGIILYELLTGRPPFDDECDTAILLHHTRAVARPVTGMPARFWALIQACLHRDPTKRPAAETLITTLRRLSDESGGIPPIPFQHGKDSAPRTYRLADSAAPVASRTVATPHSRPRPRTRRTQTVTPALVAVLILVLVVGGYATAHLGGFLPGEGRPARRAPQAAPSKVTPPEPTPTPTPLTVSPTPSAPAPSGSAAAAQPRGSDQAAPRQMPELFGPWQCTTDRWAVAHPVLAKACHAIGNGIRIIGTLKAMPGIRADAALEVQDADTESTVAGPYECRGLVFTDTVLEHSCGPVALNLERGRRYRIVARWKYSDAGIIPGGSIYGLQFTW
jgi:serine/threonine-protein kinase